MSPSATCTQATFRALFKRPETLCCYAILLQALLGVAAADAKHGAILLADVATICRRTTLATQVCHGIRRALSGTSRLSFFMVDLMTSLRASSRWNAWLDNHDTSHGNCSAHRLRVQLTSEGFLILACTGN